MSAILDGKVHLPCLNQTWDLHDVLWAGLYGEDTQTNNILKPCRLNTGMTSLNIPLSLVPTNTCHLSLGTCELCLQRGHLVSYTTVNDHILAVLVQC